MRRLLILFLILLGTVAQNITLVTGQVNVELFPVADNYADSKYPRSAYGHVPALYVGNSYDHAQNIWGSERIYIRFDLNAIPKHRVILRATLRLWQYYAPASEQLYEAHRVLADWDESKENWNNQPSWVEAKTSDAVAPSRAEVAVEWDVTSDAKSWYSGEAQNYGTMIKVVTEEHVRDASSGFWSKEYPKDEWKPRLVLEILGDPAFTHSVEVTVSGLPANLIFEIAVDGARYSSISSLEPVEVLLDKGAVHRIEVAELVTGSTGTRYRCERNQVQVASETSHVFVYAAEYLISFVKDSNGRFQTPGDGWYVTGTVLVMNRTAPDMIDVADGVRLVFDGWYADSHKIEASEVLLGKVKVTSVLVNGSMTVEGRYETEYYLNVTSPHGLAEGSGWYRKDDSASFSIDKAAIPVEGILGSLGVRYSFVGWTGSDTFIGNPIQTEGSAIIKRPTLIEAQWKDDYSVALVYAALLVACAMILAVVIVALRRRKILGSSR